MHNGTIQKSTFSFLKTLSKNNNREWFNENKPEYIKAQDNMIAFADALLDEMNRHDKIETASGKKSLYRIYNDIRFSKDKTPYKKNFSGGFRRATKKRRGGYYFHIEAGNSFVAGGFWGPNPDDLKRIRQDIDINYPDLKKILTNKNFVKTFGKLRGEQVLTAPRGYSKEHPGLELLRYKQFIVKHTFTDEEVLSPGFVQSANKTFKEMRPFLDYMTEVLTTDLNGISLVD